MSAMNLNRRSFLQGCLIVTAAAAIPAQALKALEAIKPLPILWADGVHDDSDALDAMLSGQPFRTLDGFIGEAAEGRLVGANLRISRSIIITREGFEISDCVIETLPEFKSRAIMELKQPATVKEASLLIRNCLILDNFSSR